MGDVTVLLQRWTEGDRGALDALTPIVYSELRKLASSKLARERQGHTLQPTALINEAFLKLIANAPEVVNSRAHFYGLASQLMRQVLVDHARKHRSGKRGSGAVNISLDQVMAAAIEPDGDLIALDDALGELAKLDPRKCRIIEMKFFGGLTADEIGIALNISQSTIARECRMAEAWLHRYLSAPTPGAIG